MAQHTNWDKWMSENLRYALENNKNGKKLIYTYSEYYINHYKNNGYIDIVGKERYDSELNEDVIIEIKGSLSDLNSGHGQHFIGYFNFFATNREFLDKMIIYYRNNYINSGVGILVVENDGRVNTIIPAKHNNFNYFVESNFDKFSTDDEVEEFFTDIEIPKQEYMDKHKPYYRNRCDLAGIEYVNGKIHNSIGIEIKQQLGDFKSGCGMNFCFDVNYLCVPSEFVGFTFQYLYEQNLDNVGIIEYRNKPTYYKEDLMLLKIPRYNTGNGAKDRSDCIMEKNIYNALIVTPRSAYSINSI